MSKGTSQLEIRTALNDLDAWKAPSAAKRRGSQKREPTCSAVPSLSAT
jgi:hypothetical protein